MADPYGVPGVINILAILHKAMPTSLPTDLGVAVTPITWYLKEQLPKRTAGNDSPDLVWPNGVIELLRSRPVNRVRYDKGAKMIPTAAAAEPIVFTTGTLTYGVIQDDINAITSITGTLSGAPHTFVATTDYTAEDTNDDGGKDSIVWTSGGDKPDNGTTFTVNYTHKLYSRLWGMDGRMTVRIILRCKEKLISGTTYPCTILAAVLGEALEMHMRRIAGNPLVKPHATTPTTLYNTAVLGEVLSAGPVAIDESDTLSGWAVDISIRLSRVHADTAVPAILTYDITPNPTQ